MNNTEMSNNTNLETTVSNILINKVQLLCGFIMFLVPVIGFFWKIQLDIALIKQNHEMHIEKAMEEITELKVGEKEIRLTLETQNEAIIRLLEANGK